MIYITLLCFVFGEFQLILPRFAAQLLDYCPCASDETQKNMIKCTALIHQRLLMQHNENHTCMIYGMVSFRFLYQQMNRSSAPILWKFNTKQVINNRKIILPYNVYPKPITYLLAIYLYNGKSFPSRIGSRLWPTYEIIRLVPNRFGRFVVAQCLARWT